MICELGEPSNCRTGGLAMPRSILRITYKRNIGCDFWHDVECAPSSNEKPAFFLFFCPTDTTDINERKNAKATIICVKKRCKKSVFPFVRTAVPIRGQSFLKVSDRNSQHWADFSRNTVVLVSTLSYYVRMESCFWQYLLMGGELGNETDSSYIRTRYWSSPWVFSYVYVPQTNFALIGNDDFIAKLVWKKLVFLSPAGIM